MSKAIATVWRIFHFRERFELPEDVRFSRKSGLHSTRDFVSSAAGDEAAGYYNQFGLLDGGDGLELAMFKGLYRELVNMAAQQSWAKRGYLLDTEDLPLANVQLSKLLNIKSVEMRKILHKLEAVNLVERVPLPDFAEGGQARKGVG